MVARGMTSTLVPLCAAAVCCMLSAVAANADGDQGGAVLNEVNATRAANGCAPVAANPQLTASAARHAADMLGNGVLSHTGSDGSSLAQRVTDAGYAPYSALGEVVFWSSRAGAAPTDAVAWWMGSPGHRAIITDCALTEAGFSAASDGHEMTVAADFGTR